MTTDDERSLVLIGDDADETHGDDADETHGEAVPDEPAAVRKWAREIRGR